MFRKLRLAVLAACLFLCSAAALASAAQAAAPAALAGGVLPLSQVDTIHFPQLDLARIAAEDALRQAEGRPHRFAIAHETTLDTRTAGTWEEVGSRSIWRYRVQAQGASSLNFGFTHYRLPPSAQLYIYDSQHRQLAGPWDASRNEPHGQLWTPVIAASDVVIELDVDTRERDRVELLLSRINQGYRGFGGHSAGYVQPDIGQPKYGPCSADEINSGTCNMDVACLDEADPWNAPRRAVAAITLGGQDDCTGSLVNNTGGDRRRLFATASHCGLTASSSPTAVFYWNYEWPTCRTPGTPASGQSNPPNPAQASSGATFVAATPNPFSSSSCASGMGPTCSDWTLVEIDEAFNPAWNLYWEGWDRRSVGAACAEPADPTSTVGLCASIHHPNVDEKRITFVPFPLTVSGISRGINTHWHAAWDPTPPILPNISNPPPSLPPGVTEPGSSGSPLYTAAQRLVGVLSGGSSYCGATGSALSDEYGQLAVAWEGRGTPATRMKDHLDPLGTGAEYIDGIGMSPFTLSLDPASLAVCTASTSSASVTVEVSADAGFVDPVALSAGDVPAGVGTAFSPPAVTPPGTSSLTLSALGAAPAGAYSLRVIGTSGTDSSSRSLALTLNDALPGTTALVSPAAGATDVSTSPVLSWTAAGGGPADYLVEVASDAAFANVVFSRTVSGATSVTVTPPLTPMATFHWRVRASNACDAGTWSAARSFTTGVTFPEPYCPVTFPNGVEPITRVKFSGIDHRSPASPSGSPAHEDFLGVTGGTIEAGQVYAMLVEGNTVGNYTTKVNAYIDWNRNGSFDAGEGQFIGDIINSTGEDGKYASADITVPASVTPGPVRLRVIKKYSSEAGACNSAGYGQAEDYALVVAGAASYSVGGTVSGLLGSDVVVLALNGGAQISVGNGSFGFLSLLADGAAYTVTDASGRPTLCQISNGSGTINGANVTDVAVDCSVIYAGEIIFRNGFEPTP